MSTDLSAAGLPGLPQQPIPIPERNTYVPAWYLKNPHRDESLRLYERVDGDRVPVIVNGVHVTIGMVPPERRYAVDLEGVLLPQQSFEHLHEQHYVDWFSMNNVDPAQIPEPEYRHIPSVRAFVSECVNKTGDGYDEIGYDPNAVRSPAGRARREDTSDLIDPAELEKMGFVRVEDGKSAADMVPKSEADALREENARLKAELAQGASEASPPKKRRPLTPEQRERAKENLAKARAARKAKAASDAEGS